MPEGQRVGVYLILHAETSRILVPVTNAAAGLTLKGSLRRLQRLTTAEKDDNLILSILRLLIILLLVKYMELIMGWHSKGQ